MSLRITLRALRRSPAFSAAAVLTLAIGIGASATVMTVLNAVLFKPLPYPNADRLAGAWFALPGMHFDRAPQSLATYFTYKRLARSIDGIAVSRTASVNLVDSRGDRPERLRAASERVVRFRSPPLTATSCASLAHGGQEGIQLTVLQDHTADNHGEDVPGVLDVD